MAVFAIYVTYRAMGKDYDAVVLSSGHCGFGLGATPTAVANMQAITSRFGPSHKAFFNRSNGRCILYRLNQRCAIKSFICSCKYARVKCG